MSFSRNLKEVREKAIQVSEGRPFSARKRQECMPWTHSSSLLQDSKDREGASVDNDNNYLTGLLWEFLAKYMKPLGELQSTWQTLCIIIAVAPQNGFVGLSSDPESDLHFLSEGKWGGKSQWPQALGIVHRGPEREAFSQHRDAGECVCALQIGKALGGWWWGQGRMDGRSLLLWPVSPLTPFSQEVLPISQLGLISSVLVPHEGSQPLWERNHWGI